MTRPTAGAPRLQEEYAERPQARAHRPLLGGLARQRGRPGRGRVADRHDVRALLRGQRPARRAPGSTGPRSRSAGSRARATGLARAEENLTAYFRDEPDGTTAATGCSEAFTVLAAQPAGKALVDPRRTIPVWIADISAEAADSARRLLARHRRQRRAGPRLHRPGTGHPLPRRPLPGPLRPRQEDLRPAPDAGVRRGVHPRPDADAGARRVRARRDSS